MDLKRGEHSRQVIWNHVSSWSHALLPYIDSLRITCSMVSRRKSDQSRRYCMVASMLLPEGRTRCFGRRMP